MHKEISKTFAQQGTAGLSLVVGAQQSSHMLCCPMQLECELRLSSPHVAYTDPEYYPYILLFWLAVCSDWTMKSRTFVSFCNRTD